MFTHLVLLSELRFLIPVDTWLSFGWLSLNLLLLMFMIQWNVLKLMSNFVLDISLKTTKMIYNLLKKENQDILNIWRKLLKGLLLKLHILRPLKFCKKLFKRGLFSLMIKIKLNGESILPLNMKDTCVSMFSISQLLSITILKQLKLSIWELTKMEKQLLLLTFLPQKLERLLVVHKEKKDCKFWKQRLMLLVFLKKTIGGI